MNQIEIGKFIAECRKKQNLTQIQLAEKLNVTDRAVSKWERGMSLPDISLLQELSDVLNINVAELLDGKRSEKKEIDSYDILNTLKYTEIKTMEKHKNNINLIMLSVIVFISLILIIFNLKINYYFHLKYNYNIQDINVGENDIPSISNIENKINKIRNDQGIYSDDDYKIIINILEQMCTNTNFEKESKILSKTYFEFDEIYDLYNDRDMLSYDNIYNILKKYKIDNKQIEKININIDKYNQKVSAINVFINSKYYYYSNYDDGIGYISYYFLKDKHEVYLDILNIIIKGGKINE